MPIRNARTMKWLSSLLPVALLALLAACGEDPLRPDALQSPPPLLLMASGGQVVDGVTYLGTFGGNGSQAYRINRHGHAAGTSSTADGELRAFLFAGGTKVDLGTLGGVHSEAYGINEHGQVVGGSDIGPGLSRPFLWDDGTMLDLGSLGGNHGWASAINTHGQIVGESSGRAFIWEAGVMTDLSETTDLWSGAYDINDQGVIVGEFRSTTEPRAFVWDRSQGGQRETLPGLEESNRAWAVAINNQGQIAGNSIRSGVPRPVIWIDGSITELPLLDGDDFGYAWGISDAGHVVGASGESAVAWVDGTVLPLFSGLDESDPRDGKEKEEGTKKVVYPPGTAFDVNADGTIVGSVNVDGKGWQGFVLTLGPAPEEPGTTPPGANIEVTPTDQTTGEPAPVGITFSDVVEGGETTVESGTVGQDGGPPPPSGFRLGEPPTYFDIQTTAVFSGPITICIDYSGVSYGNENVLRLLHREADGTWVDVTSSVDPATKTICGTVESLSPFLVAETNLPPVVTALALPADPMPMGSPVAVTFAYSDGNPGDTHTAFVDWGEAMTGATLDPVAGTGSASHAYAGPGVYVVTATVSDGELEGTRSSSTEIPGYIVVFDPSAGFVTGGGWIHSPAGACHLTEACVDQHGRANFGFNARYRRGARTPDGQTQFQFKAGNLNFHGTNYEWLVVAGARAQGKGTGRINGTGDYGFLLTAIDGNQSGGRGMDRFRIKIWDRATEQVVYDNQMGEDETSDAATALGGGSIVIHP